MAQYSPPVDTENTALVEEAAAGTGGAQGKAGGSGLKFQAYAKPSEQAAHAQLNLEGIASSSSSSHSASSTAAAVPGTAAEGSANANGASLFSPGRTDSTSGQIRSAGVKKLWGKHGNVQAQQQQLGEANSAAMHTGSLDSFVSGGVASLDRPASPGAAAAIAAVAAYELSHGGDSLGGRCPFSVLSLSFSLSFATYLIFPCTCLPSDPISLSHSIMCPSTPPVMSPLLYAL